MRKTVRVLSEQGPRERLARAISTLPPSAQRALREVAAREDLPLVAGTWVTRDGGCLVANVVAALTCCDPKPVDGQAGERESVTLDLRILELLPELGSRDLNRLIVAWDEAAMQKGRVDDAALRRLLRVALLRAGAAGAEAPARTDPAVLTAAAAPAAR